MKALHEFLRVDRGTPFRPGKHDCAMWVAKWVHLRTGRDPARGWRGKYRTLAAGERLAKAQGYDGHVGVVTEELVEIPPAMARIGDLAIVRGDIDDALGIVTGERVSVLRPDGLGSVDLTKAVRAWRL